MTLHIHQQLSFTVLAALQFGQQFHFVFLEIRANVCLCWSYPLAANVTELSRTMHHKFCVTSAQMSVQPSANKMFEPSCGKWMNLDECLIVGLFSLQSQNQSETQLLVRAISYKNCYKRSLRVPFLSKH